MFFFSCNDQFKWFSWGLIYSNDQILTIELYCKSTFLRAMCLIDFGIPVGQDGCMELSSNGPNLSSWAEYESVSVKEKRKRNRISHELIAAFSKKLKENGKLKKTDQECRPPKSQNFDFFVFRDQALFVGHLSETSLLVVEKSWQEVLKTFGAPVHRHIFGT